MQIEVDLEELGYIVEGVAFSQTRRWEMEREPPDYSKGYEVPPRVKLYYKLRAIYDPAMEEYYKRP